MIEFKTLGHAAIYRDGVELPALATSKQKCALLLYLGMEGPVSRDHLMALFWPERGRFKAGHSLSQTLYALKRELGEGCVRARGDQLEVSYDEVCIDARELEAAAQAGDWDAVIALYDGPFLAGLQLHDGPGFDDWCTRTRTHLARLANRAFARVIEQRAEAGQTATALDVAARWAEIEPLDDEAQHALITLLALSGDRSAALRQYREYRARIAAELEVEPLEETTALVERIRGGETPVYMPLSSAQRGAEAQETCGVAVVDADLEPADEERDADAGGQRGEQGLRLTEFLEQLRQRLVGQVLIAYLAFSWLALEFTGLFAEQRMFPEWVFPVLLTFLAVGLPLALILAWAREAPAAEAGPRRRPARLQGFRGPQLIAVLAALAVGLLIGRLFLGRVLAPPESASAVAEPDPHRVAVMYFRDATAGGSLAWLASGLTEDLIDLLQQVDGLHVISAAGVRPYSGRVLAPDSVSRALDVGTLAYGTVDSVAGQVTATVRIVDPLTGLGAGNIRVQRPVEEPLALRGLIADEIQRRLRSRIGAEVAARRPLDEAANDAAWERVQRAKGRIDDAEFLYREAVELPTAARWLGQADSILVEAERLAPAWNVPTLLRGEIGWHRAKVEMETAPGATGAGKEAEVNECMLAGIAHTERALERDPRDAKALELRGRLRVDLLIHGDSPSADTLLDAAHRDLAAALAIDPSYARAWYTYADVLKELGRTGEAKVAAEKALATDIYADEAQRVQANLFWINANGGDFNQAERHCASGRRHFPDDLTFKQCELILLGWATGDRDDIDRAWQLLAELETMEDLVSARPNWRLQVAAVIARGGLADSANSVIASTLAVTTDELDLLGLSVPHAFVRTLLGEEDHAIELLTQFAERFPGRKPFLANHPWFFSLHDNPEFQELMKLDR